MFMYIRGAPGVSSVADISAIHEPTKIIIGMCCKVWQKQDLNYLNNCYSK